MSIDVRAFCQTPTCVASRNSFLSGLYSHKVGNVWYDQTPDLVRYFPEYLHQAGYLTVSLGKEDHRRPRSPFSERPFRHDDGSYVMAKGTVTKLAE